MGEGSEGIAAEASKNFEKASRADVFRLCDISVVLPGIPSEQIGHTVDNYMSTR